MNTAFLNETDYIAWKKWSDNFGQVTSYERDKFDAELTQTKKVFDKNTKVLEIGFGSGKFLAHAKSKGWDITGTELNNTLVGVAKEHGYEASNDASLDTLPDNHFDLVVAFDVLEHIENKDLSDFVKKIANKLRVGGMFLARYPNGDSPFGMPYQNGDITHASSIGLHKMEYLASTSELKIAYHGAEIFPQKKTIKGRINSIGKNLISRLIDGFVNNVVFKGSNYCIHSPNIEVILKKEEIQTQNNLTNNLN